MKLIKSIFCLGFLLGGTARADFKISMNTLSSARELNAACTQQRSELGLDLEKATAMLLWTAFCRNDVVEAQLLREQLYANSANGLIDPEGNVVSQNEKVLSFLYFFTQNFDLTSALPSSDFPLYVKQVPLLTFGADPVSNTTTVWTGFPAELPIAELLSDPASVGLYCASSGSPPNSFDASFSLCGVEDFSGNSSLTLPSIPAVPSIIGGDPKLLSECHRLRVKVAKDGQISQQELFDLTRENSVPIFQVAGDENSPVMGFEPCVSKHKVGLDVSQASIREAVKNVESIQVAVKGKSLSIGVPLVPSFPVKKASQEAQTALKAMIRKHSAAQEFHHRPAFLGPVQSLKAL